MLKKKSLDKGQLFATCFVVVFSSFSACKQALVEMDSSIDRKSNYNERYSHLCLVERHVYQREEYITTVDKYILLKIEESHKSRFSYYSWFGLSLMSKLRIMLLVQ